MIFFLSSEAGCPTASPLHDLRHLSGRTSALLLTAPHTLSAQSWTPGPWGTGALPTPGNPPSQLRTNHLPEPTPPGQRDPKRAVAQSHLQTIVTVNDNGENRHRDLCC